MVITAIKQTIKDKERVNIYIDNQFGFALDKQTLLNQALFIGKELTQDIVSKLKDIDTFNLVSRKILAWALVRPRSSNEIKQKVVKIISNRKSSSFNKNVDINLLNAHVIKALSKYDINNLSFGKWWAENRKSQGKYGANRVYAELISKGLTSIEVKEIVKEVFNNDQENVKKILQKKFNVNSIDEIKDYTIKQKAYKHLVQKGFKPL